ncbi:MAG: flagellar basal-body rod protein FlgF [Alphaproteobacteria bacterium]|nr:flagellar basal-body rod protein FlgF [Alphaproteobacteria bacterium]
MENGIYLGVARQMALKTSMDIVANNIANMNTAGFRSQTPLFEQYLSRRPDQNSDKLAFPYDYGQFQNTAPGPQEQTGEPLQVALNGPGFIAIRAADGSTAYTRDGNFQRAADGTMVTQAGFAVLSNGGPISLPANSIEISIDESGVVSNQNGSLGKIQVAEFDNLQGLKPLGDNLYTTNETPKDASGTTVHQGFIEGSNVNAVLETTRMIEILRNYQAVQNMLNNEHDRLRSAIQKLMQV